MIPNCITESIERCPLFRTVRITCPLGLMVTWRISPGIDRRNVIYPPSLSYSHSGSRSVPAVRAPHGLSYPPGCREIRMPCLPLALPAELVLRPLRLGVRLQHRPRRRPWRQTQPTRHRGLTSLVRRAPSSACLVGLRLIRATRGRRGAGGSAGSCRWRSWAARQAKRRRAGV